MLQFELAEIAARAPESQAMLVSITKERDRAKSEAIDCKAQLVSINCDASVLKFAFGLRGKFSKEVL